MRKMDREDEREKKRVDDLETAGESKKEIGPKSSERNGEKLRSR